MVYSQEIRDAVVAGHSVCWVLSCTDTAVLSLVLAQTTDDAWEPFCAHLVAEASQITGETAVHCMYRSASLIDAYTYVHRVFGNAFSDQGATVSTDDGTYIPLEEWMESPVTES